MKRTNYASDFNSTDLRNSLWDTMQKVKNKKLDYKSANSVANVSREIMHVVKTEIQVALLSGNKPGTNLLTFSGTEANNK